MRRRLFDAVSLLSLLVLVATAVLWVRSYWRVDIWGFVERADASGLTVNMLVSDNGKFQVRRSVGPGPGKLRRFEVEYRVQPASYGRDYRRVYEFGRGASDAKANFWFAGFGFFRYEALARRLWDLVLPQWFVAMLAAVLPGAWLRRRLRRPGGAGRCPACGYDLRASPARCPECGAEARTGWQPAPSSEGAALPAWLRRALLGAPVWVVVGVCCLLPLAWLVGQIAANPAMLAGAVPSGFQ